MYLCCDDIISNLVLTGLLTVDRYSFSLLYVSTEPEQSKHTIHCPDSLLVF